jgi:hypothetical protein
MVQLEGLDLPSHPGDVQSDRMVALGLLKIIEVHPVRGSYFTVQRQGRTMRHYKDKGADCHRRQQGSAWNYVVQTAGQVIGAQLKSQLFPGFADGGRQQVLIGRLPPTPGERHVAGPWISGPVGTAYHQN